MIVGIWKKLSYAFICVDCLDVSEMFIEMLLQLVKSIEVQHYPPPPIEVSLHGRCAYMAGVPSLAGVPTWQVSLCDRCPYMTGVPTWRVSIQFGKSLYMVIIGPTSHKDLTKCEIKSSSKSLVYHLSWKSYLVIIDPNSHEKLTKIEII